ncbi:MAG: ATP-binding protein [Planctomycetota bacterium]
MRILRLRLKDYRAIGEREIHFQRTGVTVVEGRNEIGKSSLAEALDLVLDELDSTTKRKVKEVRPVDRDVGTEIEVDVETGPYAFTYFKRFFKERETILRLTKPQAETRQGREAHERVREILAATIDEHLWRVLRVQQGTLAGQANLADAGALTRALDRTAGQPRAADGDADLFASVRAEHLRYHTETGQPRKALKQLVEAEQEAAAEVQRREERLTGLEQDAGRSARLERALLELKRTLRESEALADRRAGDLRRLEERQRRVETLGLTLKTEELNESAARKEHDARARLKERAAEARRERARLEAEITSREPALREARASAERLRRRLAEAAQAAQTADELNQLRDNDFEYNRDKLDLIQLLERRAHIEGARTDAADARMLLERTTLREGMLEQIRARHLALERAEAQLEAAGPGLRIAALADLRAEFAGEAVRLKKGETLEGAVQGESVFKIPDVVELTLTAGTSVDALVAARDAAQRGLQELLAEGGVADLAGAEQADAARRWAQETVARSVMTIRNNLRDLDLEQLDDKIVRLRAWVERYPKDRPRDPPMKEDFEAAVEAKREAKHAHEEAREALEKARALQEAASARADELLEQAKETQGALRHLRREEQRAAAELARARAARDDETLAAALREAEERRRAAEREYTGHKRELDAESPAAIRELARNADRTVQRLRREWEETKEEHHRLAARLETLGERGLFDEQEEARTRLAHAQRQRERMEARADAARLLYETMRDEREAARAAYVGPLRERIVALGRLVFGDSFTVELDEGLRVTSRTLDGVPLPLSHLSVGAQEQLAIVSRLACAMLVDPNEGVPLIFDDTLGHTDPERLEGMGAMLSRAGEHCQIIVLTCTPGRFRHIGDADVIRL